MDGPDDLRFRESIFPHTLMFEEQGVCECGVNIDLLCSQLGSANRTCHSYQLSGAMGCELMAPTA